MYTNKLIIPLIVVALAILTVPFWYQAMAGRAKAAPPKLELPAGKKKCIEPTKYMREHHVDMLNLWKESVFRNGQRTYIASDGKEYTTSLTNTCLECHNDKSKFCDRCHTYVNAAPTCWECHNVPATDRR